MRLKNPLHGFKYAMEGVVHVFRTQRHMRFHFLTMVMVLLVSLLFGLRKEEVLVLLFTITLVLVAEMFNTAVEAVVDLVTQTYHPLAKFAKDIAAGAVLITVINAFAVGFLLFFGGVKWEDISQKIQVRTPEWPTIILVAFLLIMIYTLIWKVAGGKGKFWKGGVVSGHTALGFFMAVTILFLSRNIPAASIAFLMALLIAQSRVQAGIHSLREVVTGAFLGTVLTATVYWLIPK